LKDNILTPNLSSTQVEQSDAGRHEDEVTSGESVPQLVDHLFRHTAGRMISALTRYFGVENLELVEDIVQEALLKALQVWPYHGIPENPGGWLWKTAKNRALDLLRREARFQRRLQGEIRLIEMEQATAGHEADAYPFEDDQLSMMFIGCHPALSREAQIAFVLNTVSGFSAAEIARAFLVPEATMAQRLVRAKARLRATGARFDVPESGLLTERLDVVLEVLYLLFNEGYEAHTGERLLREELCWEAIHLCRLVVTQRVGQCPRAQALLALMLLQAARFKARTDVNGDLILLAEQDRSLWDHAMIQQGLRQLGLSAEGQTLSEFHLQAAIAAKHAVAETFDQTDWAGILDDYSALLEIAPSPVVKLNHAVASAMVHGAQAGMQALLKLRDDPALKSYHWLHAALGELYKRNGNLQAAAASYRDALALTENQAERRFLQKKLREIETHQEAR
jgi:RNA polymerase sigma-70 factor (ECF subfamily)